MMIYQSFIMTASYIYWMSASLADKYIGVVMVVVVCIYLIISGTCHVIYTFLNPSQFTFQSWLDWKSARIPRDRSDFEKKTTSPVVTYSAMKARMWVVLWITDQSVLLDVYRRGRMADTAFACCRYSGLKNLDPKVVLSFLQLCALIPRLSIYLQRDRLLSDSSKIYFSLIFFSVIRSYIDGIYIYIYVYIYIYIYNDVSVKYNTTLLCLLLYQGNMFRFL